jgi:hypothetical protein
MARENGRLRRAVTRTLVLLGGTVACTAAAWAISSAGASAAERPAPPAAITAPAAITSGTIAPAGIDTAVLGTAAAAPATAVLATTDTVATGLDSTVETLAPAARTGSAARDWSLPRLDAAVQDLNNYLSAAPVQDASAPQPAKRPAAAPATLSAPAGHAVVSHPAAGNAAEPVLVGGTATGLPALTASSLPAVPSLPDLPVGGAVPAAPMSSGTSHGSGPADGSPAVTENPRATANTGLLGGGLLPSSPTVAAVRTTKQPGVTPD